MSDLGGAEILQPGEGGRAPSESLSEKARQRFAAQKAASAIQRKQEGRAKRRDDRLARAIAQFLSDPRYAQLFPVIAKLVARNCPSVFLLAAISLIHDPSREEVECHFRELGLEPREDAPTLAPSDLPAGLTPNVQRPLLEWITRLQRILSSDPLSILQSLLTDRDAIDGNLRELAVFLLQEFFRRQERNAPYERIQPMTTTILQIVFEPFLHHLSALRPEEGDSTGGSEA